MKLHKGDTVAVLSGKDKGKQGVILTAFPAKEQAIVEGANIRTYHLKKSAKNPAGGIVKKPAILSTAKLAIVCGSCGKRTRIAMAFTAEGSKFRQCKHCGTSLDTPRT